MRKFNFLPFITGLLVSSVLFLSPTNLVWAAPSASLTFSPDKDSVTVDSQVKVTINTSVSEFTAGSIELTVNYDASKLEYLSEDDGSSLFPSKLASTPGNGTFYTARYSNSSGVTGSGKVTSLTFRAKATGTAQLSFSNPHIYELGTTDEKPISGSNRSIEIVNAQTSSQATATPTPTPQQTAKATPTPTPKSSANLAVTPKSTTQTTSTPTPASTATPSATATLDPNAISPTQSSVTFSNTTAKADGIDTITLTVVVRKNDGSVVTDVTPTLTGARVGSDTVSDFVFDSVTQSWSTQVVSTQPGTVTMSVAASDVTLSTQDLTFTAAAATSTDEGSSFGRLVLIGFIILLLLLLLLFFLWRRLREKREDDDSNGDDGGAAFPGEGDISGDDLPPAPATERNKDTIDANEPAGPPPAKEDVASFDPNRALQRSVPPPPPPDENKPANGTIQL